MATTPPNLAGIIKKDDVFQKGTGSFRADYVSWARIAHLLHEHAPGWQFDLRFHEGGYLWSAPDGTGYVVGYFHDPEGDVTANFPFPCMDYRNDPMPLDKCSARVLTDTHRRAMCACAAFTFGLGYELWANEEVDAAAAPELKQRPAKAQPVAIPAKIKDVEIDWDEKGELRERLKKLGPERALALMASFREAFDIKGKSGFNDCVTSGEHGVWLKLHLEQFNAHG